MTNPFPAPSVRDAGAIDRIWLSLEKSLSPARRRRHIVIAAIALSIGALGAGGGAIAYAAHTQSLEKKAPVFGDPDYSSSSSEEASMREINLTLTKAGAIGSWRQDATTIVVRLPIPNALIGSTVMNDGFRLRYDESQFTRQTLRETRAKAEAVARHVSDRSAGFIIDYYPDEDAVVVTGQFSKAGTRKLDAIPGVIAEHGTMEFQEGFQPGIRPNYQRLFFGI